MMNLIKDYEGYYKDAYVYIVFTVLRNENTNERYLVEDGEFDFTIYYLPNDFNEGILREPDLLRNTLIQINDMDLLTELIDFYNGDYVLNK